MRQHTLDSYVLILIREETYQSAYYILITTTNSAYVSIRQHTSAFVSIRQHTSAYVSIANCEAERDVR